MGDYLQLFLARLQKHFRSKRARLFCRHLRPAPQDRILDLGGGYGDYFATVVPFREKVWVAEIDEAILQRARQHGLQTALIPTAIRLRSHPNAPMCSPALCTRRFDLLQ